MKVAYIASEIHPFASTGGLADVGGSLPKSLAWYGAEVCRIMPLYRQVAEGGYDLRDTGLRLDIPVGFGVHRAEIWSVAEPSPLTYFVRRDEFFDRTQLYSLPDRDYDDNFERFVFFQKAAVALLDTLGVKPDIVHCSDWQTGLVPLFLKHGIHGMGRAASERTVFTIHNLAYQGIFPGSQYSLTNLPFFCFTVDVLEFYGNINCIKGGITSSDLITTVSKTYAQEIRTEEFGCGLHGLLARMGDRLQGIVHGADYSEWDPSLDHYLARTYSPADLSGKRACKEDLLREMGLQISPDTPLLGMVSRLVDQKGLDILAEAMPQLMQMDVGFVVLGLGVEKYHQLCREWANTWRGRFAVRLGFDTRLAHRIEAGADIYLIPSRYEPCGLSQIYSLHYGTPPVAHATGGLEDTIEDSDEAGTRGTGFKFRTYTPEALLSAIQRALYLYRKPDVWSGIMRRGMEQDFSWNRSAEEYIQLYHRLLS